jgi:hypothetical protein
VPLGDRWVRAGLRVEESADLREQLLGGERLVDEGRLVGWVFGWGEAGHVEDGEARADLPGTVGEFGAGHAGHEGVGEEELDVVGDEDVEGLVAGGGF